MLKIILIGGGDLNEESLLKIKEEATSSFLKSKDIKTMVIPFARYEEDWDAVYTKNTTKYACDGYKYTFIYPSKDHNAFLEQLNDSELVIIPGGSELSLIKNLPELSSANFDNKVIIASSAGANFLASSYYSNDRGEFAVGSNILKINTVCHFKDDVIDMVKALTELNGLPTFPLREGDFIVLYESK
jgi:peptidase E